MKKLLNIKEWKRKEHFDFFSQFDEPFFGITTTIDCTQAYMKCKEKNFSFFLYYLYQTLAAANSITSFRYRIEDEQVFLYDQIHASPTINRPDNTFGFAYLEFYENFSRFREEAKQEIEKVRKSKELIPAMSGENVIHFSSLPWIDFTSISHARNFAFNDSCPKISFGKMTEDKSKKTIPVSVHVHHALMDGYHVGQFVDTLQQFMNK